MDSPSASPPLAGLSQPRRGRLKTGALALALGLYGLLLARFMGAYAGGSDSSGYLNHARLLQQGHLTVASHALVGLPADAVPAMTFVPLGFRPMGERVMTPTYPIGLPLFLVGVASVTGWDLVAHVTLWLHAMLGVILCYLLARQLGLGPRSAATGALLLGASPVYLFTSVQALSDVPAVVWCLAAVYGAWRSRAHAGWAVLAGAAVALAVLIRPTNILILPAVAVCLGISWRRWLALAVGGAPGAVFLALVNHRLYGSVVTTGYGDVGSAFSPAFVVPSLKSYLRWLPVLLTPGLAFGFAGPRAMFRQHRQKAWVILLWLAAFLAFYAFYFHTSETWSYLRFLLPAFPALILTVLFGGEVITRHWPRRLKAIAGLAMVGGILAWNGWWVVRLRALQPGQAGGEKDYMTAAHWARSHLPPTAVVFCMQASGALHYYTDFPLVRWDQGGAKLLEKIATAAANGPRPLYAALFPWETHAALEREIPGHWTQVGASPRVSFWRFDGLEPRTTEINPGGYLGSFRDRGTDLTLRTAGGWFDVEQNSAHVWCWNREAGALDVEAHPVLSTTGKLELAVRSLAPGTLEVSQDGGILWRGPIGLIAAPVAVNFKIIDGHARLNFSSDATPIREKSLASARELSFAIYDPKLFLGEPTR